MIDAAKYADLVLLMIDGGFGFEMETFEFLNILQASGCLWRWALSGAQTTCLGSSNLLPASNCSFIAGLPVGAQGVHANEAVHCTCGIYHRMLHLHPPSLEVVS